MVLLPRLRLISPPNGSAPKRGGGSTCHIYGNTRLRDQYMLTLKKIALGNATQSRTALAVFAATLMFGGGITEASAKPTGTITSITIITATAISITPAPAVPGGTPTPRSPRRRAPGAASPGWPRIMATNPAAGPLRASASIRSAMTCAHRSLPFGTKLRVTHGGRSVVVTVNDRGPFVRGRVLDLSTAAARAVGLTGAGVGRVIAEVMSRSRLIDHCKRSCHSGRRLLHAEASSPESSK